jgi:hypothetical protein
VIIRGGQFLSFLLYHWANIKAPCESIFIDFQSYSESGSCPFLTTCIPRTLPLNTPQFIRIFVPYPQVQESVFRPAAAFSICFHDELQAFLQRPQAATSGCVEVIDPGAKHYLFLLITADIGRDERSLPQAIRSGFIRMPKQTSYLFYNWPDFIRL